MANPSDKSDSSKSTRLKGLGSKFSSKLPKRDKTKSDSPKDPAARRRNIMMTAAGVVTGLVLLVLVFGVLIYKYKSDSRVTYAVAKIVPYPAMKVNGHLVSYKDYLFQLNWMKQFYENQPSATTKIDFSTTAGQAKLKQLKQQILVNMKSDEVARQLIAKNKVKVTDKQVSDEVTQLTQQAGGQAKLQQVLATDYGWSMNDLRAQVKFQLAKQALQTKLTNDPHADAAAKAKAQDILNKVNAGGDFAALAKQYSQDSTAANGGDLGFFSKGQMDPTFEAAAFALQPGQVSGLVRSQYGYHIIKVTDKKGDQVRASHILIQPIDFNQYMKDQTAAAKAHIYVHI